MKNFCIQSLTLTAMIVMVYTASLHSSHKKPEELLQQIHAEVDIINKTTQWHNKMVPKIPGNRTTCVRKFFCYAEKALETIPDLNTTKLVRLLRQYNKAVNDTNCELTTNSRCSLKNLLQDIKKCSLRQTFPKKGEMK